MAFILGFFLEASIGLISFWFLEVSSLLFVYMLFSFFLSGHMFPLDMLPRPMGHDRAVSAAAIPGLFPAAVIFLGKIQGPELWLWLLAEVAWMSFFMCWHVGCSPRRQALQWLRRLRQDR